MANRQLLHISKLEGFKEYLGLCGWQEEMVKGAYEALRMRHPSRPQPLILFKKASAKEHLTVMDQDVKYVKAYLYGNSSNLIIMDDPLDNTDKVLDYQKLNPPKGNVVTITGPTRMVPPWEPQDGFTVTCNSCGKSETVRFTADSIVCECGNVVVL